MDSLEEKKISSEEVYTGNFLRIYKDKVELPDGKVTTREYIKHPGAAAIIPLRNDGKVVIERQWRYPAGKAFLEIPAGKLDPKEEPLSCAKRELLEETGYLAKDLIRKEQHLDPGEFVELSFLSWQELVSKSVNGEITDVKTIIAALWLEKYLMSTENSY